MSCFRLPQATLSRIDSIISSFWWGQKDQERRIHWVAWARMCKSKKEGGLGFRDVESFNKAMLAKQGWRLIREEKSLLAQTLKARYYPRGTFLSASIGYNPSYTWRSILAGREVLSKGICWVVGDGSNINVWEDPWLPDMQGFRVSTTRHDLPIELSVRDLLLPSLDGWDRPKVEDIFGEAECRQILRIPIHTPCRPDHVAWHFSKSGMYTVKTGYHVARRLQIETNISGDEQPSTVNPCWSDFWSFNIPPKIKVFVWRCTKNALPVSVELQKRGVDVQQVCRRCGTELESLQHVFMGCEWSRGLWNASNLQVDVERNMQTPIQDWLISICTKLNEWDKGLFLVLLWFIWFARNQLYFQNKLLDFTHCLEASHRLLLDFQKAHELPVKLVTRQQHDGWQKPPPGFVKLNTDASCRDRLGTGIGGAIRSDAGVDLQCFVEAVEVYWDVDVAEAIAYRRGIEMATRCGVEKLIIEMDSQVLFNALTKRRDDLSYFGNIVDDIRTRTTHFTKCSFRWIRREANSLAHNLSRFAFDSSLSSSFEGLVPPQFRDIVIAEAVDS